METADVDAVEQEVLGEASLADLAFEQIARDIALFSNRQVDVAGMDVARTTERPCGRDGVHISFKVAFEHDSETRVGCLFVPLPEAITLACLLLLEPSGDIAVSRGQTTLDQRLKDSMLEVGNLVGGALDNALRWFLPTGCAIRAASCQGVRAGMPPWLDNPEGTEYLVARSRAKVDVFDECEWTLVIPHLFDLEG